jgi:hypothetical protein
VCIFASCEVRDLISSLTASISQSIRAEIPWATRLRDLVVPRGKMSALFDRLGTHVVCHFRPGCGHIEHLAYSFKVGSPQ